MHFLVMSYKWSSCKWMVVMDKFPSSVATLVACEKKPSTHPRAVRLLELIT